MIIRICLRCHCNLAQLKMQTGTSTGVKKGCTRRLEIGEVERTKLWLYRFEVIDSHCDLWPQDDNDPLDFMSLKMWLAITVRTSVTALGTCPSTVGFLGREREEGTAVRKARVVTVVEETTTSEVISVAGGRALPRVRTGC